MPVRGEKEAGQGRGESWLWYSHNRGFCRSCRFLSGALDPGWPWVGAEWPWFVSSLPLLYQPIIGYRSWGGDVTWTKWLLSARGSFQRGQMAEGWKPLTGSTLGTAGGRSITPDGNMHHSYPFLSVCSEGGFSRFLEGFFFWSEHAGGGLVGQLYSPFYCRRSQGHTSYSSFSSSNFHSRFSSLAAVPLGLPGGKNQMLRF